MDRWKNTICYEFGQFIGDYIRFYFEIACLLTERPAAFRWARYRLASPPSYLHPLRVAWSPGLATSSSIHQVLLHSYSKERCSVLDGPLESLRFLPYRTTAIDTRQKFDHLSLLFKQIEIGVCLTAKLPPNLWVRKFESKFQSDGICNFSRRLWLRILMNRIQDLKLKRTAPRTICPFCAVLNRVHRYGRPKRFKRPSQNLNLLVNLCRPLLHFGYFQLKRL